MKNKLWRALLVALAVFGILCAVALADSSGEGTDVTQYDSNGSEYTEFADNGRKNALNQYNAYHKIDENTGEYIDVPYSSWRACETYFAIPEGAVIFNYLHDAAYTAASVIYCFYDSDQDYLGAPTVFKVTSENVHSDTWEEHPGTYVIIPEGAAYYRIWEYSGTFHSIVLQSGNETSASVQNITPDDSKAAEEMPQEEVSPDERSKAREKGTEDEKSKTLEADLEALQLKADQISVTTYTEYIELADNGRKNPETVYDSSHSIDEDTGEYVETSIPSQMACETYFQIPEGALIYNYLHDPEYISADVAYFFYDGGKEYLGASTIFRITRENVHRDTWNEHPGTWVTIPEGAVYYRLCNFSGTFHSMVLSATTSTKVEIPNLVQLPLRGKTVLALGDSVWGNDRTNGIADFLAEYTGATVLNGAIGGTRITDLRHSSHDSPDYVYFDGVKLVHALVTGDWTEQDAYIDSVSSAYVSAETLPMLKALDLRSVDIVTIAYGFNDITTGETADQIKAALEVIVKDLLGANPALRIVVLTPPWRMFSSGTVDGDDYVSSGGLTLRSLGDALIDEAKALHVPWIDMLTDCPWNLLTKEYYMESDCVHPNIEGNKVYAHVVSGKLKGMY